MMKLKIIYEDQDLIAVYKPSGVPVQTRNVGQPDLENAVKNHIAVSENRTIPYLGIIHRLDQPVEGITLFAKNKSAAAALSRELQENKMKKIYLAVTSGVPAQKEGMLEDWILFDRKKNISRIVKEKQPDAKKAVLSYEILQEKDGFSKIKILLKTGRHHQIRVQMANAGMPLAGDHKYNSHADTSRFPALCASELEFRHPKTGKQMTFKVTPENEIFSIFL